MGDIKNEVVSFWQKFSIMLPSGIPLLKVIDSIKTETSDNDFRAVLEKIYSEIQGGEDMSSACSKHPLYFTNSVVYMIKAGEAGGVLDVIAKRIADGLEDGSFEVSESGAKDRIQDADNEEVTPPAVQLVNQIIKDAIDQRASDIHIEWLEKGMQVRYRIDGVLKVVDAPPEDHQRSIVSRIKIMAAMDVAEKRKPQDGRIILTTEGKEIDLRVGVVPAMHGEAVTIRLLSKDAVTIELDALKLNDRKRKIIDQFINLPHGIVVVSGPTGSGKTTTLYAMLNEVLKTGVKVISAENPVEYLIDGVTQLQVRPHIGLSFESLMRAMLRQDPDVLMMGEVHNREALMIAVQAALTGHLVMTTLHCNDGASTIRRILDIGIEPFLVNSSLAGVVAQRLIRRVCQDCKEEHTPEWLPELPEQYKDATFYKGKGCGKCNGGYKGRMAINELVPITNELKKLIATDPDIEALTNAVKASDIVTLKEDGLNMAVEGLTTVEEVYRVAGF